VIYPTLGPICSPIGARYGVGHALDIDHLRHDYGSTSTVTDRSDPRVTPLMFEDLTGAPSAIVSSPNAIPFETAVAYAGCSNTSAFAWSYSRPRNDPRFLRLPTMCPKRSRSSTIWPSTCTATSSREVNVLFIT